MSGRILHINEFGSFYGGTEQYIYDIANLLSEAQYENSILFSSAGGKNPEDFQKMFVKNIKFEFENPENSNNANIEKRFLDIFDSVKPDLIFFHRCGNIKLVETAARYCPTLRMVHDHNIVCLRRHKFFFFSGKNCNYPAGLQCILNGCILQKNPRGKFPPLIIKSLNKKLQEIKANKKLTCMLTASKFMRDELAYNGFANNVKTIPLFSAPFDIDKSNMSPKPDYSDKNKISNILFVGEILRGKGLDLLFHSLKKVKSDFTLSVIGDGNAMRKNKKLCEELGLKNKTTFLGWIPHEKLGAYFSLCDLFVFPARWNEPFGLTGTEALSLGKPVVAFNTGGISEWLWDAQNGYLVESNNINKFAENIDKLISDENLRRQLGQRGKDIYNENFTVQRYKARLIPLIESIIKGDKI